jgi:NAD(P)-dependent dehydrogenase (short-subunit alcohol dehydrogenase family)
MKWNGEFKGKVAVITGAASGLGRQTALQFAADGANIVIGDIQVEKGKAVVEECKAAGGDAIFVETNVGDEAAVKNLMETAVKTFGTIDILVNNAGGGGGMGNPWTRPTVEDWDKAYATMMRGTYLCCKYVYDLFKQKGSGKIVNFSSEAGKDPTPELAAYSANKAALIAMTTALAKELGPYGVNVNAVCPGLIYTPIWEGLGKALAYFFPDKFKGMSGRDVFDAHRANMQCMPQIEVTDVDIANAVLFFCSEAARSITGQALNICAGMAFH